VIWRRQAGIAEALRLRPDEFRTGEQIGDRHHRQALVQMLHLTHRSAVRLNVLKEERRIDFAHSTSTSCGRLSTMPAWVIGTNSALAWKLCDAAGAPVTQPGAQPADELMQQIVHRSAIGYGGLDALGNDT